MADANDTIVPTHPVLSFAREEWDRLLELSDQTPDKRSVEVWIGTWEELKSQQPLALEGLEWRDSGYSDDFVLIERDGKIALSGKSERATLYAVYQYAQENWGLHSIYPGVAPTVSNKKVFVDSPQLANSTPASMEIRWYAPRMERRGFVFETINDPPYLIEMIDWFAHNKINEIFFTFTLWDQVGAALASEIIKRGIRVTLGGHSMKFFINKEEILTQPQADHPYTAKAQLNFHDSGWQAAMVRDITEYCQKVPNLNRISLWPEDIADRGTEDFLAQYMQFTEQLKEGLLSSGLEIEVEHIAYNAGLAWNMLELGKAKPSADVDTLYAFWGRDYQYGYEDCPHESNHRARAALENWASELGTTDRKLTFFEYYSDHYMLSNLFPFLPQRIMNDVAYYEKLSLHGMVNLVVPYRGPDAYPWKWVHQFNSYVFCRALWSDNLEEILGDYYAYYPESERAAVRALFEVIEAKLAGVTSWNIPLFPARAVDPEKANASKEQKDTVLAALLDIRESIQLVLQEHPELNPQREPYQYGQHLIDYSEEVYQRWLER